MKKSWNKRRLVPVAILLALVVVCGSVFAYMFMRTDPKGAQFIPAKVSCQVYDVTSGNQITDVTVKNTGNIPAYLRVRLVTYWVNGDGNVVPKDSLPLSLSYDTTNWVAGSGNTYYYKLPVNPNAVTTNLFAASASITLASDGEYKQRVDIFGEAIQALPTTAATSSWGVTITDGEITGAP